LKAYGGHLQTKHGTSSAAASSIASRRLGSIEDLALRTQRRLAKRRRLI
jgi:hypothetical protein